MIAKVKFMAARLISLVRYLWVALLRPLLVEC